MSYIDRNLLPDEQVIFRTKKHIIIFLSPLLLTVFLLYAAYYMHNNPILINLEWAPLVVAFIFWANVGLEYMTSEFVVTSKRVMMREGFFTRHTNELRLAAISQVVVDQSIIGQIFNYGAVSINAFGAYDSFSVLSKPYGFQKSVNEQMDKVR